MTSKYLLHISNARMEVCVCANMYRLCIHVRTLSSCCSTWTVFFIFIDVTKRTKAFYRSHIRYYGIKCLLLYSWPISLSVCLVISMRHHFILCLLKSVVAQYRLSLIYRPWHSCFWFNLALTSREETLIWILFLKKLKVN